LLPNNWNKPDNKGDSDQMAYRSTVQCSMTS